MVGRQAPWPVRGGGAREKSAGHAGAAGAWNALSASVSRQDTNQPHPAPSHGAQACYAMGYNLAIEYLADYEKTWMLDAFRALNERVLAPAGRPLTEWVFLEVRGEGGGVLGGKECGL